MTIEHAAEECRRSALTGWELVEYAQQLVHREMKYSFSNSFDLPEKAFEKGMGYCWQQASALNLILKSLGFTSWRVQAYQNRIPESEFEGVVRREHVSGHVWCKVEIDGETRDVCPGNGANKPGVVHFTPLTKVKKWNPGIAVLSYFGSAMVNARRLKKIEKTKKMQEIKWNPARCPCRKTSCPRHGKCEECKQYHYSRNGLPRCERG
jgi:hypothetical protein